MIDLLFNNQQYLLYLIGVMISVGVIKDNELFTPIYIWLTTKVKSKRSLIFLISSISGVLPIPGRVVVSSGVLDTIAPKTGASRQKYGVIGYLSTHHYYLWSPLEKTIIIPMAALGLSYLEIFKITLPLLIISMTWIYTYIFFFTKEDDIVIEIKAQKKKRSILFTVIPLIITIGLMVVGIKPWIVFGILPIYYMVYTKTKISKILGYVNINLIFFVALIIAAANCFSILGVQYINDVRPLLLSHPASIYGAIIASFIAAFMMGSSSKFAGIVVIMVSIFGMEYFLLFFTIEFCAYLISPMHKCVAISKMYFGTSWKQLYSAIVVWCLVMIFYVSLVSAMNGGI